LTVPTYKARWISYINDFRSSDLSFINTEENLDLVAEIFSSLLTKTLDKHAPIKQRKNYLQPAPYMNSTLRKSIYKKKMMYLRN
jgi:hypothetical protein